MRLILYNSDTTETGLIRTRYWMQLLNVLGIDYVLRTLGDLTQSTPTATVLSETDHTGTFADEDDFDGCIVPYAWAVADTGADAKFLATKHPWPVFVAMATNCYDGVKFTNGRTNAAVANTATRALSLITGGSIYTDRLRDAVKSDRWGVAGTANAVYTELISDAADATKCIVWRRKSDITDVIYANNLGDYTTASHVHMSLLGYYLGLIGKTAPQPLLMQFDADDLQTTDWTKALGESSWEWWAEELKANDAFCVCGVYPAPGSIAGQYYQEFIAHDEAKSFFAANSSVFPAILHQHAITKYYWSDDTAYPTPAMKIAGVLADCATSSAETGLNVRPHYDGYVYMPSNTWSQMGLRAMMLAGVKYVRLASSPIAASAGPLYVATHSMPGAGVGIYQDPDTSSRILMQQYIGGFSGSSTAATWAQFINNANETEGLAVMSRQMCAGFWNGCADVMCHGNNWNTDAGEIPMFRRLYELMVKPLMEFSGKRVFRLRKRGEMAMHRGLRSV